MYHCFAISASVMWMGGVAGAKTNLETYMILVVSENIVDLTESVLFIAVWT